MTLSDISIKNPVFAWMIMAALIIFGAISFNRMGVSQMPDVDFPVVNISVTDQGAAPEVMESDIVNVIEDSVMTVEGVKHVSSNCLEGLANISVEFDLNRNIDAALQEVETKVAQAQKLLPTEMDPPIVTKTNPEDNPILWLALYSTDPKVTLRDMMIYVSDSLKDQISSVSGVGDVRLGGYLDPNMRVWVDNRKLNNYQLTVNDVINTIQAENVELPSGFLETPTKDSLVRTKGEAGNAAEFGQLAINTRGGLPNYHPIRLKDVATLEEGLNDITRISYSNGQPGVGLGIVKQRGTNAVAVADAVKAKVAELNKTLPPGMAIRLNFDSTQFIKNSVHELERNLVLSALATALVCWIFLGSWSSTLNILLAIPTSIVGTFIILYFSGFTLNTFTLLGLSLAVGIVVDDAIMVLENIVRHQEHGMHRVAAAVVGAREITFAALATSLAIVAIFLPVAFMSGIIGKFFFQFGVTLTGAVLLSLLEALTLTPMRCSQFVEVSERRSRLGRLVDASFHGAATIYSRGLAWSLRHRWIVLLTALAVFIGSLALTKVLRKEFVPSQDEGLFLVSMKTPVDSSIGYTDAKFKLAEAYFASNPAIKNYYVAVGGFQGSQFNQGIIFVTMKAKGQRGIDPTLHREPTQADMINESRKALNAIPDVQAFVQDISTGGFTASRGFPVEIGIQGPDWDTLAGLSEKLKAAAAKSGYLTDVDTDYQAGMPELDIIPNREESERRGVSVLSIAQTVNAMIGGQKVGQYPRGQHRDDVRVRLIPDQRMKASDLKQIYVRNNRGEVVSLASVASFKKVMALQQINHYDRQRTITLFANVAAGRSQTEAMAKVLALAAAILPPGYHTVLGEGSSTFNETGRDLIFALLLGVVAAYMVLASQFNSFVDPFSVLMALPFSLSGAFLGLWIFGLSLNIYSMIGLILLMGIVKKNSIMLVDFTNQIRSTERKPVDEALLKASPIRFRPILMTSMAVIAAALPEALTRGPGYETQEPMAVVLIFGMAASTLLTLFVVPCFYSLTAPLESRHAHEDLLAEALAELDGAAAKPLAKAKPVPLKPRRRAEARS